MTRPTHRTAAGRRHRVGSAHRHHTPRRGGTLIETIVAMVLLTVAIGSVLTTSGAVAREMGGGMSQTVAASVAQSRLDSLASLSCAQLSAMSSGSATTLGISEKWSVVDGTHIKILTDTLTVPRRSQALAYSTVVPCQD
ncbi:MAG: hypothetical protein WCK74_05130 [Gemmatimonadaceae bacterium]